MQSLHRARSRLVGERTPLINQLRALLLERGITIAQGRRKLQQRLALLLGGEPQSLPLSPRIRLLIEHLHAQWNELDQRIAAFDPGFATATHEDEAAKRLATIPETGLACRCWLSGVRSVKQTPPAASAEAHAYFTRRLSLETDCADVHEAMMRAGGAPTDFVLLDVRGPAAYARSHVPGALSLPHRQITAERTENWPEDTLFVVYCAGPHCNGADHAALRLAELGRPVKLMLGGMTGWADEGFAFACGEAPGSVLHARGADARAA